MYPTVYLRRDRRLRVEAGHPWIFQSEIGRIAGEAGPADIVRVVNHAGAFLGVGYISDRSQIAVRLLSRTDEEVNVRFFRRRLEDAWSLRKQVVGSNSNCYRLVYGEADGLPGLTVDIYGRYASVQVLALGMERWTDVIVEETRAMLGLAGVILRNDAPVRQLEGLPLEVRFATAEFDPVVAVQENGFSMTVDLWQGQKTGYFLDQRENRAYIAPFLGETAVLDCFSHTGSFAVHAAGYGAKEVTAVDISRQAVLGTLKNAENNGFASTIKAVESNAFDFLREASDAGHAYDVVMLDPPAFTKNKHAVPAARRGYKEINLRGLKLTRRGGFLITSSCSYHLSREEFLGVLAEAARDAHRQVKVVAVRGQGGDHPALLAAPETEYLKFVVAQVF
ncbi:MAG: Ribosomal RNA large subunit methyltransferase I [Firmicutes bacterium]|nr:Ribosomal RNA large subunit methyltransferase I [candidate division NPL-UPA2 bacterium]